MGLCQDRQRCTSKGEILSIGYEELPTVICAWVRSVLPKLDRRTAENDSCSSSSGSVVGWPSRLRKKPRLRTATPKLVKLLLNLRDAIDRLESERYTGGYFGVNSTLKVHRHVVNTVRNASIRR
jgi:hypothetical protein